MSQKVSRKSAVNEDKDKRQTNSPVKEMKKKMAANAEKEKQAAEKATEKTADKTVEKPTEKTAEKATEKTDKTVEKKADKSAEKTEKHDKNEKPDKVEKKVEKQAEKKSEPQAEKIQGDSSKEEKIGKPEKEKPDAKKPDASKQKANGRERAHNGVSDVTLGTNGTDDVLNGTVSADSEDDDVMLVIDDHDELFPELTYDDTSDVEGFEPPTPDSAPSRSFTRRSQVKSTRTPETPRPASDKQTDKDADDPKDKVLKLREDAPAPPTDRKLRSADSPKPQEVKKPEPGKKDLPRKSQEKEIIKDVHEKVDKDKTQEEAKKDEKTTESQNVEIEITVEIEGNDGEEVRKTDTNYSKSRVKVSPYRRSMRLADQTNTSVQANYTGNNTTMEMDITESSSFMEDAPLDDSSYLRGLRSIRGRSSYKPLKEITLRHVTANRSVRSTASTSVSSPASDAHSRPTGTVVGRKRKPEHGDVVETEVEANETCHVPGKRMRVLDRLAEPFRRVAAAAALPSVARRNADIVGINTDLPLTAPVASPDTFDPESLKPLAPLVPPAPFAPLAPLGSLGPSRSPEPVAVPLPTHDERDNKRCVVM